MFAPIRHCIINILQGWIIFRQFDCEIGGENIFFRKLMYFALNYPHTAMFKYLTVTADIPRIKNTAAGEQQYNEKQQNNNSSYVFHPVHLLKIENYGYSGLIGHISAINAVVYAVHGAEGVLFDVRVTAIGTNALMI